MVVPPPRPAKWIEANVFTFNSTNIKTQTKYLFNFYRHFWMVEISQSKTWKLVARSNAKISVGENVHFTVMPYFLTEMYVSPAWYWKTIPRHNTPEKRLVLGRDNYINRHKLLLLHLLVWVLLARVYWASCSDVTIIIKRNNSSTLLKLFTIKITCYHSCTDKIITFIIDVGLILTH